MNQKGFTIGQLVILLMIIGILGSVLLADTMCTRHHQAKPASTAVTVNSTDGITQAEVDSLQIGDLLRRNDGLIVAIAHIKDDDSIHYWGKGHALTGDYTCSRSRIRQTFNEVYKLHTPPWIEAAENFIMKQ